MVLAGLPTNGVGQTLIPGHAQWSPDKPDN